MRTISGVMNSLISSANLALRAKWIFDWRFAPNGSSIALLISLAFYGVYSFFVEMCEKFHFFNFIKVELPKAVV